jgi:hypothetical protein
MSSILTDYGWLFAGVLTAMFVGWVIWECRKPLQTRLAAWFGRETNKRVVDGSLEQKKRLQGNERTR